MIRKYHLLAMTLATMVGTNAFAEVSADEAKQLGGPVLTLLGAERAGNKDGTIPEYSGLPIKPPAGWEKSKPGNMSDPWNEKPLFTITAQNADKYADKLDGMKEIFKKYPNYRMDIYPSHRNMNFPKIVLDNTVKNATSCKAIKGELILEGCYGGYPFPIPKTGAQAIWNHLMEYEGQASRSDFDTWVVTPNGSTVLENRTLTTQNYPYYDPARTSTNGPKDLYWEVRVDMLAPARRAGEKIVLLDAVDSFQIGRRAYQYIPGQRRVKLAPDIAYDTPSPFGGGGMTMDESKVFLGAIDRFEWKLIGKKEKYILYNAFSMTNPKVCGQTVFLTKNFPNPDCMRWELHRVWVVQATLKPGFRHIYHKRMFFFDEDGYLGASGENYDAADKLYRVVQAEAMPLYNGEGNAASATYTLDLQTGAWVIQGYHAQPGLGVWPISIPSQTYFSPESLAAEGIR